MYGFTITYGADGGKITIGTRGDGLGGLYALTDCQMVEVAGSGVFGGVPVAILCDEEGLYREGNKLNLSACDVIAEATKSAPMYLNGGGVLGTCSIVSDDNLRGFTADEVAKITRAFKKGGYPYAGGSFTVGGIEVNVITA